ncbi:MAG: AAA family ATPase [Aureispira sp.]
MYIKSLAARNNREKWELEKVTFDYNFTLFVGISGAGKTQILKALDNLRHIVSGGSIGNFEWDVILELENGKQYQWAGSFYYDDSGESNIGGISFPLVDKEILRELDTNILIIDRNRSDILFNGVKLPKMSKRNSAITLFIEEEPLKDIGWLLNKIIYRNNAERRQPLIIDKKQDPTNLVTDSLEEIKKMPIDNLVKYYLAQQKKLPIIREIEGVYNSIFEDVDFIYMSKRLEHDYIKLAVSIRHKNNFMPIEQEKMSSGMLRVLMLLIDLYFSPDGSIFLIDEIENSLGINCLDEYVYQLHHANPNIQIIATSHHPYIINNIPYQQWKVVKRKGAAISVVNAEDLGIGQSRQEAFIQLNKVLKSKS